MNWKTYNGMTAEQKEEYNFKFKNKPLVLDGSKLVGSVSVFLLIITQFMFIMYLAVSCVKFLATTYPTSALACWTRTTLSAFG